MILTGNKAEATLNFLLQKFIDVGEGRFNALPFAGYFEEAGLYTCFDNTSYNCWVEQAKTKELAEKWCAREIEANELYMTP